MRFVASWDMITAGHLAGVSKVRVLAVGTLLVNGFCLWVSPRHIFVYDIRNSLNFVHAFVRGSCTRKPRSFYVLGAACTVGWSTKSTHVSVSYH